MKNFIISILLLFTYTTLLCQPGKFANGYIILNEGDTLFGKIKLLLPITYSESVTFITNGETKPKNYTPSDLKKFYFENSNYYQSDSIPFRSIKDNIFYKKLFVKKLLSGHVELYRLDYEIRETLPWLTDFDEKFYFYRENGKSNLIDLDESNYRIKIKAAFRKYSCDIDKSLNYRYNDVGLSNLISEYNICRGGTSIRVFLLEKPNIDRTSLGLLIGIASSSIQTTNHTFLDFDLNSKRHLGYDISLLGRINLNNNLFIRSGLNFKHRSYNFTRNLEVNENYDNVGEILNLQSNITINQLNLPISLMYTLINKRTIRPYIFAGGFFGAKIKNTASAEETIFRFSNGQELLEITEASTFNSSINHFEFGLFGGLGTEIFISNNSSTLIELKYVSSINDRSKETSAFISQGAYIFQIGFNHSIVMEK